MKKGLIFILLLVFGIVGGIFFGISKARATSPVGEISAGESTPSVTYDEYWRAASALTTINAGAGGTVKWATFSNFPNDTNPSEQPKMVVTKWIVHGHIHFR